MNEGTPSGLTIQIRSHLRGVGVRVSGGPNASDPLAQRGVVDHFTNLHDAVAALPAMIDAEMARTEMPD